MRTPGTLAFAPIVDGDLVPDYPVAVARAGRTHPVPLIIGTNKHEAALFRFMKSPLMPITPAGHQGDVRRDRRRATRPADCPARPSSVSTYRGPRARRPGMGVARDIGFRMPSIWFAEGHAAVAPVYIYRFDWATPMLRLLRLGAAHATELPYVWGNLVAGPQGSDVQAGRAQGGHRGLGAHPDPVAELRGRTVSPTGLPGEPRLAALPRRRPRHAADRQAATRWSSDPDRAAARGVG